MLVPQTLSSADQMSHIGHLRQAVKFVADDAADGLLPGFCLGPKKVSVFLSSLPAACCMPIHAEYDTLFSLSFRNHPSVHIPHPPPPHTPDCQIHSGHNPYFGQHSMTYINVIRSWVSLSMMFRYFVTRSQCIVLHVAS